MCTDLRQTLHLVPIPSVNEWYKNLIFVVHWYIVKNCLLFSFVINISQVLYVLVSKAANSQICTKFPTPTKMPLKPSAVFFKERWQMLFWCLQLLWRDQGHLHPLLEHPRYLYVPAGNRTRTSAVGAKSYSNSLLVTIQSIYMRASHSYHAFLFFKTLFALGGSPTPHPISSRPHFCM